MKNGKKKIKTAAIFFTVAACACFSRLFILDTAVVSGDSMLPGLKNGQRVFINKLAWGIRLPLSKTYILRWGNPEPGDIGVFLHNGMYNIKRCTATGGMDIVFSNKNGYSVIAGNKYLPLSREQYGKLSEMLLAEKNDRKTKIPADKVFVTGDNPQASVDSRDYGLINIDSFCGKILFYSGKGTRQ